MNLSDRCLRVYVSARTRIQRLPTRVRRIVADQSGQSQYLATGLLIAMTLVIGGALVAGVPGLVSTWVNHLLGTCLSSASTGTTGTGCP